MGGNALKHCTGRFSREKYASVLEQITTDLKYLFPGIRVEDIKFYEQKESFGDMDLLVSSSALPSNWVHRLLQHWEPADHHKNGNVLSVEYDGIQVDLIVTKDEDFDSSALYFAYNDLGNLMGRIAHKFGLKYGHEGLGYPFRDGDNLVCVIPITKDPEKIFSLLGYDYGRWQQGFKTLEDIFEFTADTAFFNPSIYLLENRNHIARMRDRKRASYTAFLSWCRERYPMMDNPEWRFYTFSEDKKTNLPYIFDNFPEFRESYNRVAAALERKKAVKLRFNGDLVRQITGREGKDLGEFMTWLRKNGWEGGQFEAWVLGASDEEIADEIRFFYEKWVNQ